MNLMIQFDPCCLGTSSVLIQPPPLCMFLYTVFSHFSQTESTWCQSVHLGLNKKLKENILVSLFITGYIHIHAYLN